MFCCCAQTLVLSYAYHCCEFMPLMEEADEEPAAESPSDLVILPPQHIDPAAWANTTDIWAHYCTYHLTCSLPSTVRRPSLYRVLLSQSTCRS